MSNLVAVIVNIVSSLIFFVLGYLLRSLTRAASRARLARQWGMPLVGKVGIYVGARESVVEPTGDMGVGDAFALQEMGQYLDKVGVPYDLIYIRVALKQEPDGNLILLGGPDANVLTKNALEHINRKSVV